MDGNVIVLMTIRKCMLSANNIKNMPEGVVIYL